jgi:hypothetical protein
MYKELINKINIPLGNEFCLIHYSMSRASTVLWHVVAIKKVFNLNRSISEPRAGRERH